MAPSEADCVTTNPKTVTVYAAASTKVDDKYKADAFELGRLIAQEGWIQVNGGSCTGLMGAATEGALAAGGIVDCVILDKFVETNHNEHFRHVTISANMPDRKAGLSENADAFIALPGGLGTLDEIAEVLCMRQLSFHEKPIVLVNTNHFYDHFKKFVQNAVEGYFIAEAVSQAVCFADTPRDGIEFMKGYKPIAIDKTALYHGEIAAAARHAKRNK